MSANFRCRVSAPEPLHETGNTYKKTGANLIWWMKFEKTLENYYILCIVLIRVGHIAQI